MTSNQNVGRDELAALLGASHASDMVAAATANDTSTNQSSHGASGRGAAGCTKHYTKGGEIDEDISKMDRAQAASLVARKFAKGGGVSSSAAAGGATGTTRHRATGKRKRMLQHHLLVGDLMEQQQNQQQQQISLEQGREDVAKLYQTNEENKGGEEEEEDSFIRHDVTRKKTEAKVLARRDNGKGRRRRGSSSSSDSESSSASSSSSSDGSARNRRRNINRGRRRSRSNSSSSSSSEDEADIRRRRARERASQKNQREIDNGVVVSIDKVSAKGEADNEMEKQKQQNDSQQHASNDDDDDDMPVDNDEQTKQEKLKELEQELQVKGGAALHDKKKNRKRSDSSSSSSRSSSSSSSSDSSSSSSDESDHNTTLPMMSISKPLFVPKSKRGTVAAMELQQQKHDDAEKQRALQSNKRAIQSRALVAEAVSAAGKNGVSNNDSIGGEDEFDTGEAGGDFIVVPDDTDPTEEDSPDLILAERDAWEVRELIRMLRDIDQSLAQEKERKELERRRGLTDEERLTEDKQSGRYRAPGESRRQKTVDNNKKNYLQKFHHRGAFYMDEETLEQAGPDDIRHRAAEYSRSATGEDNIKSELPEVMQVKNFGLAGYSTKYKGLAKEDTTDKKLDFLPIQKGTGRGNGEGGHKNSNSRGDGANRDRYR